LPVILIVDTRQKVIIMTARIRISMTLTLRQCRFQVSNSNSFNTRYVHEAMLFGQYSRFSSISLAAVSVARLQFLSLVEEVSTRV